MYKRITIIILMLIGLVVGCRPNEQSVINNNNSQTIKIKISNLSQDSIFIEYNLEKISEDSLIFRFPLVIPGSYNIYNINNYISKINCFDKNDNKLDIIKKDKNSFLIINSKNLKKIHYSIKKGNPENVYDALTKIVTTDSFCLINPISVLGYFDNYRNIEHLIEIIKPNKLNTFYVKNKTTSSLRKDLFKYSCYDNLVENPILYSMPDTTILNNSNFNAKISVYSDNKNISSSLLKKWINPLTSILNKYTSIVRDNKEPYRFIFVFSDKFISESALEQENASAYCLRANWDTTFLRKMVQHLVVHEYLHTITPLEFHSNIYDTQLFNNFTSKHLWLYEGIVEYLSLKTMLVSQQINRNEFFNYLSQMKYSNTHNKNCYEKSIIDISSNILSTEYTNSFDKFYSKGALFAFCIDLTLSNNSKGKDNLILLLQKYIKKNGIVFNENNFIKDFLSFSQITNINLYETDDKLYQIIDSMLLSIGYSFTNQEIFWSEHFEHKFNIDSSYVYNNKYYIKFGTDSYLKNKTIELVSINNEIVSSKLINKNLIYPVDLSKIEINYIYNAQTHKSFIKPLSGMNAIFIKKIKPILNITLSMENNYKYFCKKITFGNTAYKK